MFAGFARDVAAALAAFDLSVFPSLWEGTPLTAFEALAVGKPIVATDADGLLDILTDGRDARIVPKRDARALADEIVWLMDGPAERARLRGGRAARPGGGTTSAAFVAQDGAALRAPARGVAARRTAGACSSRTCRSWSPRGRRADARGEPGRRGAPAGAPS